MKSLKKAWEQVRDRANVQCGLHDLRHTACTKMAESGVPEMTMLAIMGHVDRKMLQHYLHSRSQAKIEAMKAVEARSAFGAVSHDSPHVEGSADKKPAVTH